MSAIGAPFKGKREREVPPSIIYQGGHRSLTRLMCHLKEKQGFNKNEKDGKLLGRWGIASLVALPLTSFLPPTSVPKNQQKKTRFCSFLKVGELYRVEEGRSYQ